MTDEDFEKLRAVIEAPVPQCVSHGGKTCDRCGRAMIVDGYIQTLRACRDDVDEKLAQAVPALLDEIERLRNRPWERLRELGYEVDETGMRRQRVMEHEIVALRAALAEALYIFDTTWCPEFGHSPEPDQIKRMGELMQLVPDEVKKFSARMNELRQLAAAEARKIIEEKKRIIEEKKRKQP